MVLVRVGTLDMHGLCHVIDQALAFSQSLSSSAVCGVEGENHQLVRTLKLRSVSNEREQWCLPATSKAFVRPKRVTFEDTVPSLNGSSVLKTHQLAPHV